MVLYFLNVFGVGMNIQNLVDYWLSNIPGKEDAPMRLQNELQKLYVHFGLRAFAEINPVISGLTALRHYHNLPLFNAGNVIEIKGDVQISEAQFNDCVDRLSVSLLNIMPDVSYRISKPLKSRNIVGEFYIPYFTAEFKSPYGTFYVIYDQHPAYDIESLVPYDELDTGIEYGEAMSIGKVGLYSEIISACAFNGKIDACSIIILHQMERDGVYLDLEILEHQLIDRNVSDVYFKMMNMGNSATSHQHLREIRSLPFTEQWSWDPHFSVDIQIKQIQKSTIANMSSLAENFGQQFENKKAAQFGVTSEVTKEAPDGRFEAAKLIKTLNQ